MVLSPQIERPGQSEVPFAPHVEELHEFLAARGLQFGSPDDIFPFLDRLSASTGFRDELTAMIRTTAFGDGEALTRVQLLELVAIAVGGPEIDLSAPRFKEPVRQLFAFTCEVHRSLRKTPADAIASPRVSAVSSAAPVPPRLRPVETTEAVPTTAAVHPMRAVVYSQPATPLDRNPGAKSPIFPARTLYSRTTEPAQISGEAQHSPEPEPVAPAIPERPVFVAPVAEPALAPEPRLAARAEPDLIPVSEPVAFDFIRDPSRRRRFFWTVGSCAVLVGLVMGLPLHHRPAAGSSAPSVAAKPATSEISAAPKPSPYGVGLRDTQSPKASLRSGQSPTRRSTSDEALEAPPLTSHTPPRPVAQPLAIRLQPSRPSRPTFVIPTAVPVQLPSYSTPLQPISAKPTPYPPASSSPAPYQPANIADFVEPVAHEVAGPRVASHSFPAVQRDVSMASSGIMTGNLLSAPSPAYPAAASAENIEGEVTLQAVVGRDGSVIGTHVLRGDPLLAEAAAEAVRRWRYRPYLRNGEPTIIATVVTMGFRLHH